MIEARIFGSHKWDLLDVLRPCFGIHAVPGLQVARPSQDWLTQHSKWPTASGPASWPSLRASLAEGDTGELAVAGAAIFPDLITLSATVACGGVPSRRARPYPGLRPRPAHTWRFFP